MVGGGHDLKKGEERHSPDIGINLKLAMSYTIRGRAGGLHREA